MRTYCRWVDITDPNIVSVWVLDFLQGGPHRPAKWRRRDFVHMMSQVSDIAKTEIRRAVDDHDYTVLLPIVDAIAAEAVQRINNRELELEPITYFTKADGSSGKVREIACESCWQQIFDCIAVNAMMPMLRAKITPHQYASIRGRGGVQGKEKLEKWVRRDKRCTVYAKADVSHCFQSLERETVMGFLRRDLHKNPILLWLIDTLLRTYKKGLNIGSLLSQWLCNYVMSYVYRYAERLGYKRRDKNIRIVLHQLFYMDDMYFSGANRKRLISALRKVEAFMASLGLHLHKWFVFEISSRPIDMMGFVVAKEYTVLRGRLFLRARRALIRAYREFKRTGTLTVWMSRKLSSYKGYFDHSNSRKAAARYKLDELMRVAVNVVSKFDKKRRMLLA